MKTSKWFAIVLVGLLALVIASCKHPVYTVAFDSDGGTAVDAVLVKENETVSQPEDPEKKGYKFLGWYLNDEAYDFNLAVLSDLTLKAKWELIPEDITEPEITYYIVTFDADGGSKVESAKVKEGDAVTAPKDPTKEGFTFEGWYNGKVKYDFKKAVTKDITLKAQWKEVEPPEEEPPAEESTTWKVTFNSDGGSAVAPIEVTKGEKITAPANPTKAGYKFDGWYLGTEKYNFAEAPTKNITLKAVWLAPNYVLPYNQYGPNYQLVIPVKDLISNFTDIGKGDTFAFKMEGESLAADVIYVTLIYSNPWTEVVFNDPATEMLKKFVNGAFTYESTWTVKNAVKNASLENYSVILGLDLRSGETASSHAAEAGLFGTITLTQDKSTRLKPTNAAISIDFGLKDVEVAVTDEGTVKVLTASAGFTTYAWMINSEVVSTDSVYRFDTAEKLPGKYEIDLMAMKNTMPYFTQVKITISEESNE